MLTGALFMYYNASVLIRFTSYCGFITKLLEDALYPTQGIFFVDIQDIVVYHNDTINIGNGSSEL